MICPLEDLPLFRDRMNHGFQRRAAISDAKSSRLDLGDHLGQTAADGAEILDPLVPQKPALIGRVRIFLPSLNELPCQQFKIRQTVPLCRLLDELERLALWSTAGQIPDPCLAMRKSIASLFTGCRLECG